jgi:hypothetical protein
MDITTLSGGAAEVARVCHVALKLYRGTVKLSTPAGITMPPMNPLHIDHVPELVGFVAENT